MQAIQEFRRISKRRIKKNNPGKTTSKLSYITGKKLKESGSTSNELNDEDSVKTECTYCPYDRSRLLLRLQSYPSDFLNHRSSDGRVIFNALVCAKNGWCFTGESRIQCVSCGMVMSLRVPNTMEVDDFSEELGDDVQEDGVRKALMKEYYSGLKTGHYKNCPWLSHPTPDFGVYEIGEFDDSEVKRFVERYLNSLKYKGFLESVQFKSVLSQSDIRELRNFFEGVEYVEYVDPKVAELALFGWSILDRIGEVLILYSETDGRKLPVSQTSENLDLIEEHQSWDCFVDGYKKLLNLISFKNQGIQSRISVEYVKNEHQPEGSIDETSALDDDIEKKLEGSLLRLEQLKKVYME